MEAMHSIRRRPGLIETIFAALGIPHCRGSLGTSTGFAPFLVHTCPALVQKYGKCAACRHSGDISGSRDPEDGAHTVQRPASGRFRRITTMALDVNAVIERR